MRPKLIAFDLDGTLLNNKKEIPEENLLALRRAAEAGVLLVPATGRILKGMPEALLALKVCRYFIFSNGATLYDLEEDRTIGSFGIAPETALRICEYMDTLPVLYDCYRDGFGYMTQWMYEKAPDFFGTEPEILKLVRRLRQPVPELKEDILRINRPLEKLQMYFTEEHMDLRLRELETLSTRFPEVIVSSSTRNNVEINSREAGKGKALRRLCELLGIRLEETAAFGDGLNDTELLEAAGLGCAMQNAAEAVKRCADTVLPYDNNAGGVGRKILEMLEERT